MLATSTDTASSPALAVALWMSVLPWLEDSRWLSKAESPRRGNPFQQGGFADSPAPAMEPVEEMLEVLQERVLSLFGGALGQLGSAPSVSGSSTTGDEFLHFTFQYQRVWSWQSRALGLPLDMIGLV